MTKTTENNIRTQARELTNQQVGSMVSQIVLSLKRRDEFEKSQGLDLEIDNSYTRERDQILANKHNVARLFIVCGVKASEVIERQVTSTSMFNAKALKKVREIANFVCGDKQGGALPKRPLEKVVTAFVAGAMLSTDSKVTTMQNALNKNFLSSTALDNIISDEQLREDIAAMRAEHGSTSITGGKDTQSSQVRNVLDVLGLGTISSVDKHRDAITINRKHGFYELFASRYMTKEAQEAA